ncbi:MAG: hypothetical protein ACJ8R9_21645, partial [Steroidobacteraceae bacterium]
LVFFATLTFLAVNVANTLYFWRCARYRFKIIDNLLVPAVGALFNIYLIYASFFSALWANNWRTGKSVVVGCVSLLAVQVISAMYIRIRKPHLLTQGTPIGTDAD